MTRQAGRRAWGETASRGAGCQGRKKWIEPVKSDCSCALSTLGISQHLTGWKPFFLEMSKELISQLDKPSPPPTSIHTCTLVALELLGIAWWSSSRKLYLFWSWMLQVTYRWAMGKKKKSNKYKNTAQWDGDDCTDSLNEQSYKFI